MRGFEPHTFNQFIRDIKLYICEKCSLEHNTKYGSGRFCSPICARSFSTSKNRKLISEKVSKKLKGVPNKHGNRNTPETIAKCKSTWLNKILTSEYSELSFDSKRRLVLHEQDYVCNKCGINEWFGKKLSLEIDHINGISDDDRRENLEILCPNCHAITDTWRGRNKSSVNGFVKVSDEDLLKALNSTKNIRQALLKVGLAAKGGNYERAKSLLGSTDLHKFTI